MPKVKKFMICFIHILDLLSIKIFISYNDTTYVFFFAAVINKEEDIAAYTIKTVDDPRTLNKILYINPPKNTLSMNEMVSLWETKISKSLEKTHIPEEQVLKLIQGLVSFLDFFFNTTFSIYQTKKMCYFVCVCVQSLQFLSMFFSP